MINITVAYATPEQQTELPLQVEASCTVAIAIKRSGIQQQFPEINLASAVVGIHGKRCALDASLHEGDRIEIYRPLTMDPKQARVLRGKVRRRSV